MCSSIPDAEVPRVFINTRYQTEMWAPVRGLHLSAVNLNSRDKERHAASPQAISVWEEGTGWWGEPAVLENELDFKTAYQVALGD